MGSENGPDAAFYQAVQTAAQGTPFVLEKTPTGFDLRLEIVDAQWHTLTQTQRLRRTFTYHVNLDIKSGTYTLVDDMRSLSVDRLGHGRMSIPISMSGSRNTGRIRVNSMEKVWAFNDRAEFGQVVDYHFRSSEGHALIRSAAVQTGWTETMSARQKGAIAVAVVAALIAVLTAVAAVVVLALHLA